jgi:hypothetical protein
MNGAAAARGIAARTAFVAGAAVECDAATAAIIARDQ